MDSRRLFDTSGFAVIGASPSRHYARSIVANMRAAGYPDDRIALVNPRYDEIDGLPCHPSLEACPVRPSVVAVTTGERHVADALRQAGTAGAGAALVLASGYAEAGAEGRERQRRLGRLARDLDLAVLGPSSLGYVAPPERIGAWAAGALPGPLRPGPVALVFQSSGMLNLVLGLAIHRRLGVRAAAAVGTEADLDAADLIRDLAADPATGVIGLVVEGTTRPAALTDALAVAADRDKPVVVLKLGRSERARRNTQAHSGRLAGSDRVWQTVLSRFGALVVDDLDELLATLTLLSAYGGTRSARVGAATISGGDCSLISDLAERHGVPMPPPAPGTHARMVSLIGKDDIVGNPLDCENLAKRDPDAFAGLIRALCGDPGLDVIAYRMNLAATPTPALTGMYQDLLGHARQAGKRPVVLTRAAEPLDSSWFTFFAEEETPFLLSYGTGFAALGRLARWARRPAEPVARPAAVPGRTGEPGEHRLLSWSRTAQVVAAAGVPYVPSALAVSPEEAGAAAGRLGYPVVAKVWAAGLSHKSDVGGVRVGLRSADEVRAACADMARGLAGAPGVGAVEGFEIQAMAAGGVEVMVGLHWDATFGPVVLVGSGGLYAEANDDVAMALPPIGPVEARAMVESLAVAPALLGARGREPHDVPALCDLIVAFGRYAVRSAGELADFELNPVMVGRRGEGVVAVDALAVTRR